MLVHEKSRNLVLNLKDVDRVHDLVPHARKLHVRGHDLLAVPHNTDEVQLLRNPGTVSHGLTLTACRHRRSEGRDQLTTLPDHACPVGRIYGRVGGGFRGCHNPSTLTHRILLCPGPNTPP